MGERTVVGIHSANSFWGGLALRAWSEVTDKREEVLALALPWQKSRSRTMERQCRRGGGSTFSLYFVPFSLQALINWFNWPLWVHALENREFYLYISWENCPWNGFVFQLVNHKLHYKMRSVLLDLSDPLFSDSQTINTSCLSKS